MKRRTRNYAKRQLDLDAPPPGRPRIDLTRSRTRDAPPLRSPVYCPRGQAGRLSGGEET